MRKRDIFFIYDEKELV